LAGLGLAKRTVDCGREYVTVDNALAAVGWIGDLDEMLENAFAGAADILILEPADLAVSWWTDYTTGGMLDLRAPTFGGPVHEGKSGYVAGRWGAAAYVAVKAASSLAAKYLPSLGKQASRYVDDAARLIDDAFRGATRSVPTPGKLAEEVAQAIGGTAKPAARGVGQVITVPYGNREIVIRIMQASGSGTDYYRVSVAGKQALTVSGAASTDQALTHIPIAESSYDDILRIVQQLQGGGG
jgi:hypothetical protein